MGHEREFVHTVCYRMKEGEKIRIEPRLLIEGFPCGWPTMYRNPAEAFLSSMVGSAWGVWRVRYDFIDDVYIISRHKESNKRYYVEAEREHLFKQQIDGTWESRFKEQ